MNERVAIYLRVSTSDQSTDLQRREIDIFVKARGWENIQYYEEKASGTNTNRPELRRLIKDARERSIDVVVCWKLDRFARSLRDMVNTLQELSELRVAFISLKDNIDLTTSSGRLMMHLLASFAEFEAALIKERVRAGLKAAREKGTRLGRPLSINTSRAIELRKQGLSLSKIAKQLGVSKSSVSKTLTKHWLNESVS